MRERGRELGLRVGNSLVEKGNLEGTACHLEDCRPAFLEKLALLHLRTGNIPAAQSLLPSISSSSPLPALTSMSTGDFHNAASQLSALTADTDTTDNALLLQNLALCLLYTNQLPKTRDILEDLVSRGWSFHTLLWNLATVYELCSERAAGLKVGLAERVAKGLEEEGGGGERWNGAFKL